MLKISKINIFAIISIFMFALSQGGMAQSEVSKEAPKKEENSSVENSSEQESDMEAKASEENTSEEEASEEGVSEEEMTKEKALEEEASEEEASEEEEALEDEALEDDESFEKIEDRDPIAPFNKFIFGFNRVLDGLIIRPLTMTYKYIIPPFMRTGVHNVLGNLNEPVNFVNALLQFEGTKAGHSLVRFLMNTIFGLGGVFDIASNLGIYEEKNDFGITLSKWGFGEGFYLVLPVLGPSNFRDGIGKVVDYFLAPAHYYIYFSDRYPLAATYTGAAIIDTRFNLLEITDTLDKSEDLYTNYRVTFTDNRRYITREFEETEGEVPFEEELYEDDAV